MSGRGRLRIGLEAGFDPGWPAGLMYVRNLVYALTSLETSDQPAIRLLPLNNGSVDKVSDLARYGAVEIATPAAKTKRGIELALFARRLKRRFVQPLVGRTLDDAFRDLDVTFPDFGRPLPGVPQMHWIPDLQHVHLPHLFEADDLARRNARVEAVAAMSDVVVFSSESARDDFLELHPRSPAKARVWRFCTTLTEAESGGRDPHDAYGLPPHYLYVANQFWAHKEHLTLFEALRLLRDSGVRPAVVCTGVMDDSRDPGFMPRVRSFIRDNDLGDQVTLLGVVPRNDQIEILRHSAAVVQPSRFEGWSTVLEDTKAIGRPTIASDIAVHREQVPDAVFFEVGSAESLARVIEENIGDLDPGPDPEAEGRAAVAAEARRREAGERFVEIAMEAVRSR